MKLQNGKENCHQLQIFYGVDEFGFTLIPPKVGGRVSRTLAAYQPDIGCPLCFLFRVRLCWNGHRRDYRSWKRYRKHQWSKRK